MRAHRELARTSDTPDRAVTLRLYVTAGYGGPLHLAVNAPDQAQADRLLERLADLPEVKALQPQG
jgi:hypothetical protein